MWSLCLMRSESVERTITCGGGRQTEPCLLQHSTAHAEQDGPVQVLSSSHSHSRQPARGRNIKRLFPLRPSQYTTRAAWARYLDGGVSGEEFVLVLWDSAWCRSWRQAGPPHHWFLRPALLSLQHTTTQIVSIPAHHLLPTLTTRTGGCQFHKGINFSWNFWSFCVYPGSVSDVSNTKS